RQGATDQRLLHVRHHRHVFRLPPHARAAGRIDQRTGAKPGPTGAAVAGFAGWRIAGAGDLPCRVGPRPPLMRASVPHAVPASGGVRPLRKIVSTGVPTSGGECPARLFEDLGRQLLVYSKPAQSVPAEQTLSSRVTLVRDTSFHVDTFTSA